MAERAFHLVTSAEILGELGDVLQRPAFRRHVEFTDFEIMRAIRALRGVAQMVPGAYVDLKTVPTDPGTTSWLRALSRVAPTFS